MSSPTRILKRKIKININKILPLVIQTVWCLTISQYFSFGVALVASIVKIEDFSSLPGKRSAKINMPSFCKTDQADISQPKPEHDNTLLSFLLNLY